MSLGIGHAEEEIALSHTLTAGAVVFVADVRRVGDFYRALAAMAVRHEDAEHAVLEVDGFQLVIHRLPGEPAVQPDAAEHVSIREDSYIKLCIPVTGIAPARRLAGSLGGAIRAPEFEWTARGFRACDGHDPEGNVFQVREFVPEPAGADDGGA